MHRHLEQQVRRADNHLYHLVKNDYAGLVNVLDQMNEERRQERRQQGSNSLSVSHEELVQMCLAQAKAGMRRCHYRQFLRSVVVLLTRRIADGAARQQHTKCSHTRRCRDRRPMLRPLEAAPGRGLSPVPRYAKRLSPLPTGSKLSDGAACRGGGDHPQPVR